MLQKYRSEIITYTKYKLSHVHLYIAYTINLGTY